MYNNMNERIERFGVLSREELHRACFEYQLMNLHVHGIAPAPAANGTYPAHVFCGSSRIPRPFQVYPSMFPTHGLYDGPQPLNLSATASEEALAQERSNLAYAEFRAQMLAQTHGDGKRLNHIQFRQQLQLSSGSGELGCFAPFPSLPTPLAQAPVPGQQPPVQEFVAEPPSNGMQTHRLSLIQQGTMPSGVNDSRLNSAEVSSSDVGKKSSGSSNITHNNGGSNNAQNANDDSEKKSKEQKRHDAYLRRRDQNKEAAKKARAARRVREDTITIRAVFLEHENRQLQTELCAVKNELQKLQSLLETRKDE